MMNFLLTKSSELVFEPMSITGAGKYLNHQITNAAKYQKTQFSSSIKYQMSNIICSICMLKNIRNVIDKYVMH